MATEPVTTIVRALLVEADSAAAAANLASLEHAGFAIDSRLITAPDELDSVGPDRYDVVLSAYHFHDLTGMDVLQRVRRRGCSAPFILVTSALGDELAIDCLKQGAADFVLKDNRARLPFAVRRAVEFNRAVANSEARFYKVADASFDGIAVTQEGVMREVNRGFLTMFGYAQDTEVIGRNAWEVVAPESRAVVQRQITEEIDGTYEFVGLRRDGSTLMVQATAKSHPVDGKPGRITALRNISAHRELEAQFRHAQKMEAIGRLAGGVAHDFNNLLTVIGSYTDFLLEDLATGDPRRADVEQIRSAASAAAGLTRQLLTFSRQQVIQPRVIALNTVVAAAEKLVRRVVGEDITLGTHLGEAALQVRIDPGQIDHILMNLVVNARDAMPKGGHITIETDERTFDETYVRSHWPATVGRYAMLAVSDTGTGMTDEVRARIFEPFFTTKEEGKGTGLGLATVYGMVKQNNGYIWVYSEPGRGAAFKVYLPLVLDEADHAAVPEPAAPSPGRETVLLAEDAPAVRTAARLILERYGYTVLEAPGGRDALAIAEKHNSPIHLLLTDMVMPQMSGGELAEAFTRVRPDARVLYMSGYTDDAVVRHGVLTANARYLQKPFTADSLARKVREALDEQR